MQKPLDGQTRPMAARPVHLKTLNRLTKLERLLVPLMIERFRDRLMAIALAPQDLSGDEKRQGLSYVLQIEELHRRAATEPALRKRLDAALNAGEEAHAVLRQEMFMPSELTAKVDEICAAVAQPETPSEATLMSWVREHAQVIIRRWYDDLNDAGKATKVVQVDDCMLPIRAVVPLDEFDAALSPDPWPGSCHPGNECSSFVISAKEMRELFRELKRLHSPAAPLPPPMAELLLSYGITAVNP